MWGTAHSRCWRTTARAARFLDRAGGKEIIASGATRCGAFDDPAYDARLAEMLGARFVLLHREAKPHNSNLSRGARRPAILCRLAEAERQRDQTSGHALATCARVFCFCHAPFGSCGSSVIALACPQGQLSLTPACTSIRSVLIQNRTDGDVDAARYFVVCAGALGYGDPVCVRHLVTLASGTSGTPSIMRGSLASTMV